MRKKPSRIQSPTIRNPANLAVFGDLDFVVFVVSVDQVLGGLEGQVDPLDPLDVVLAARSGVLALLLELSHVVVGDDAGEPGVALKVAAALDAEHQERLAAVLDRPVDLFLRLVAKLPEARVHADVQSRVLGRLDDEVSGGRQGSQQWLRRSTHLTSDNNQFIDKKMLSAFSQVGY